MMNTSPQMTSVEPSTRIPAWRSVSPKNFNTRRRKTSPTTLALNCTISPNDSIQPRGVAISCSTRPPPPSDLSWAASASPGDRRDLRVRRQQRLGEGVVEREDAQKRDHNRLVDGAAHPFGTARRRHPLVTTDHGDDRAEQRCLEHRPP